MLSSSAGPCRSADDRAVLVLEARAKRERRTQRSEDDDDDEERLRFERGFVRGE